LPHPSLALRVTVGTLVRAGGSLREASVGRSQNEAVVRSQNEAVSLSQNEAVVRSQNEAVSLSQNEAVVRSQNEAVWRWRNEAVWAVAKRSRLGLAKRSRFGVGEPKPIEPCPTRGRVPTKCPYEPFKGVRAISGPELRIRVMPEVVKTASFLGACFVKPTRVAPAIKHLRPEQTPLHFEACQAERRHARLGWGI
jgi:hypothetical protein